MAPKGVDKCKLSLFLLWISEMICLKPTFFIGLTSSRGTKDLAHHGHATEEATDRQGQRRQHVNRGLGKLTALVKQRHIQ